MATKEKGRQWDGRSRPSTDLYKKNFDKIFGKKEKNYFRVTYGRFMKKKRKN